MDDMALVSRRRMRSSLGMRSLVPPGRGEGKGFLSAVPRLPVCLADPAMSPLRAGAPFCSCVCVCLCVHAPWTVPGPNKLVGD